MMASVAATSYTGPKSHSSPANETSAPRTINGTRAARRKPSVTIEAETALMFLRGLQMGLDGGSSLLSRSLSQKLRGEQRAHLLRSGAMNFLLV